MPEQGQRRAAAVDVFIAAVRRVSCAAGLAAGLLLLAAVVAVCHLVVVRYALAQSAVWQHEFVTYSLIGATFLGSPYVLLTRGHINVDLLPLWLGMSARRVLAVAAAAVGVAFCVLITWTGAGLWHEAWAADWHSDTVWGPPLWIPYLAMPVGMGLVALQYVADIAAVLTGRESPFGITAQTYEGA